MTVQSTSLNDRTQLLELHAMPNGGGSDRNLKKNIRSIRSGLAQIVALRPVTWHWKEARAGKDVEHGFVAQEVEEVLPSLVYADAWDDGTTRKFLSTKDMIPYLVAAVQEQQKQIEALTSKLEKRK